jgi:hypothetical protein
VRGLQAILAGASPADGQSHHAKGMIRRLTVT